MQQVLSTYWLSNSHLIWHFSSMLHQTIDSKIRIPSIIRRAKCISTHFFKTIRKNLPKKRAPGAISNNKEKAMLSNKSNCTSIPPMQNSTISTQMNQADIKKYRSIRNAEATMMKTIAPLALISNTSFSESSLFILPVSDGSCRIKVSHCFYLH